mmetsp:Transcript_8303/g.51730  ORF Transcript_8303/g.51730 Transcript_8303/m.51730 type:complete len:136 (-) Transcript_8303:4185-4592(-)
MPPSTWTSGAQNVPEAASARLPCISTNVDSGEATNKRRRDVVPALDTRSCDACAVDMLAMVLHTWHNAKSKTIQLQAHGCCDGKLGSPSRTRSRQETNQTGKKRTQWKAWEEKARVARTDLQPRTVLFLRRNHLL